MRSPLPALVRTGLPGLLALVALAGCSKKTIAPNSQPLPEGQQNGSMLMLGWPEQASISFRTGDPGTPESPGDDFLDRVLADYWADPAGVRATVLDVSSANQVEVFRTTPDGNAQGLFDYFLPPTWRFIGQDLDAYDFEDFSPGSAPEYVGRGAHNGVSTESSPLSNLTRVTGAISEDLDFLPAPKSPANDSTIDVQFSEDPRAEFYVVEVADGNSLAGTGSSFALERRLRGIPSALQPGVLPLRSELIALMPKGSGLTGFSLAPASHIWPQMFYIRVTAYDADGQMVNRVNDYFRSTERDGNTTLTNYEPMGGALQLLDPYPSPTQPLSPPDVLTHDQAMAILKSFGGAVQPQAQMLSREPITLRPTTPQMAQALSGLARHERFSAANLRAQMAAIRAGMAQGAAVRTGRSAAARGR